MLDHRIGNKVSKQLRKEEAHATRVDPHPYIGIVKNNLDPTKSASQFSLAAVYAF